MTPFVPSHIALPQRAIRPITPRQPAYLGDRKSGPVHSDTNSHTRPSLLELRLLNEHNARQPRFFTPAGGSSPHANTFDRPPVQRFHWQMCTPVPGANVTTPPAKNKPRQSSIAASNRGTGYFCAPTNTCDKWTKSPSEQRWLQARRCN